MNWDLHSHSTASDGLLAPAEVVRRAQANGVTALALTDHDTVDGLDEAAAEARRLGIRFVPGIEISVSWGDHTLHVVGLGIDPRHPELVEGIDRVRGSRRRRGERIAGELAAVGIEGSLEGALAHAGNPDALSRTHFARFLVERNHARDVKSVFNRFLSRGRPGFVPHEWAELSRAVAWIRAGGGVAVLAHPARYGLAPHELEALLDEFRSEGGLGIEVVTGSHTAAQQAAFARVARRMGFLASRGSDYHGPGESRSGPGLMPELPADLKPVWSVL